MSGKKKKKQSFFKFVKSISPLVAALVGGVTVTAVFVIVDHSFEVPVTSPKDPAQSVSPSSNPTGSEIVVAGPGTLRDGTPLSSGARPALPAPLKPSSTPLRSSPPAPPPPPNSQAGPPAVSPTAGLAGYALGGHHVLYVDSTQHVQELFREKGSVAWEHYDQSRLAGAPSVGAGSGLAGYAYDGVNYAAFLDDQGHVRGLEWTQDIHKAATDATASAGAPPAAPGTGLAGYWLGGHHLIYVDVNQHVQELYRAGDSARWEVWDQSKLVGAPPAARNSGVAGYAYKGFNHAAYIDEQGHVQMLEWTSTVHKPAVDLTASANALPAAGGTGLAGYVLGGQHVLYVDVNRHVQALWVSDGGSVWEAYDHTAPGDVPPATAAGGLAGYALDGVNYAAYLGNQGSLLALEWTTAGTKPGPNLVG